MKVLQINTVCGRGSTGRIATDLSDLLHADNHTCRIAYGRYNVPDAYKDTSIRISSDWNVRIHGIETRLFDTHGFGCKKATKNFLKWVEEYNPDIIHLHNIHGYYLNIELLFDYLKHAGKPVIWTLHDCWSFTGHCSHYTAVGCSQWKDLCRSCSQLKQYPACYLNGNVKRNFERKKAAFTGVPNMTVVTPSKWLAEQVSESFLGDYPIQTIQNGIDLSVFHPTSGDFREKNDLVGKQILLGVANAWTSRKGLDDFMELASMLTPQQKIVLVGLTSTQVQALPNNILGIQRTNNIQELAEIYTAADIFLNPTQEDTFPTVNLEALACGTPVITYRTGGSPETLDETCGIVTQSKTPAALFDAIRQIEISKDACILRAAQFDKHQRFQEYIALYLEKHGGSEL